LEPSFKMPTNAGQSSRGAKARQTGGQPARRGRPPKSAAAGAAESRQSAKGRPPAKKAKAIQIEDEDEDEEMDDGDNDEDEDEEDDGGQGNSSDGGSGDKDDDDDEEALAVPEELVLRILQQHLGKTELRITKNAGSVLALYMDVFVKEAIARSGDNKNTSHLDVSPTKVLYMSIVPGLVPPNGFTASGGHPR
jgi:centromere protein X